MNEAHCRGGGRGWGGGARPHLELRHRALLPLNSGARQWFKPGVGRPATVAARPSRTVASTTARRSGQRLQAGTLGAAGVDFRGGWRESRARWEATSAEGVDFRGGWWESRAQWEATSAAGVHGGGALGIESGEGGLIRGSIQGWRAGRGGCSAKLIKSLRAVFCKRVELRPWPPDPDRSFFIRVSMRYSTPMDPTYTQPVQPNQLLPQTGSHLT
jgi:hypothetical protein